MVYRSFHYLPRIVVSLLRYRTIQHDNDNDNDKPIKSLMKGKGLLPPVGRAQLDSYVELSLKLHSGLPHVAMLLTSIRETAKSDLGWDISYPD
jgi:hypothetical protein